MNAESFLPLRPRTFHVLLALRGGPQHGYGIKKNVEARTEGRVDLDPGGLYRLVARLEDEGLVEPADVPETADSDDQRRRYYALTHLGIAVLEAEARRLTELASWPEVVSLVGTRRRT